MNYYVPPPGAPGNPKSVGRTLTSVDLVSIVERIEGLENEVMRLRLTNQALSELLMERTGVTPEQLAEKLKAVDMRDGKTDGMLRDLPNKCAKCGRLSAPTHQKCMYCGASFATAP